jgi:hypothetical protein
MLCDLRRGGCSRIRSTEFRSNAYGREQGTAVHITLWLFAPSQLRAASPKRLFRFGTGLRAGTNALLTA